MEPSGYTHHQTRLRTVLKRILAEAGDLLSLSFPHDYRQHSIITLSQTLKHSTQRLLLALGRGGRREEEEEEERGGSASGTTVIGDITREVESTAQDLKKEVEQLTQQHKLSLPLLSVLKVSPLLPPVDECSDGPVVRSLPPATGSSCEGGDGGQGREGDHC